MFKRGNIVQTYPAVEYDFWPKTMEVTTGECIAFQWTGSNTHNNGNPAGDGQAGDAGEGQGGTDRHNLAQILTMDSTYPMPLDKFTDFFTTTRCYKTYTGEEISTGRGNPTNTQIKDVQMYLMTNSFYDGVSSGSRAFNNIANNEELNELLNDTPASMRSITCCPETAGEYYFTNTRNNNFTNRDQKLVIKVTDP